MSCQLWQPWSHQPAQPSGGTATWVSLPVSRGLEVLAQFMEQCLLLLAELLGYKGQLCEWGWAISQCHGLAKERQLCDTCEEPGKVGVLWLLWVTEQVQKGLSWGTPRLKME